MQRGAAHLLGIFVLEKVRIKPGRRQSPEIQSPASVGLFTGSAPFFLGDLGKSIFTLRTSVCSS